MVLLSLKCEIEDRRCLAFSFGVSRAKGCSGRLSVKNGGTESRTDVTLLHFAAKEKAAEFEFEPMDIGIIKLPDIIGTGENFACLLKEEQIRIVIFGFIRD